MASDYNFDHPGAFDFNEQLEMLENLRHGAARVELPNYDFVTHSRLPTTTAVEAPQIVIFEGLFTLYDERLRDFYDLKVFVDADADVRLSRRIRRDIAERGRDLLAQDAPDELQVLLDPRLISGLAQQGRVHGSVHDNGHFHFPGFTYTELIIESLGQGKKQEQRTQLDSSVGVAGGAGDSP